MPYLEKKMNEKEKDNGEVPAGLKAGDKNEKCKNVNEKIWAIGKMLQMVMMPEKL